MRLFVSLAVTWAVSLSAVVAAEPAADSSARQYYEVRTYELGAEGDEAALDEYLGEALIPALERQGIGPVGAFAPVEAPADQRSVVVVIPFDNPAGVARVDQALAEDKRYQQAAQSYLQSPAKRPPFARIRSEFLRAFACMPELKVPGEVAQNEARVYELRIYESATERLGDLKVDMFNNGEVPIFLDSGIRPVFFGQAIIGPNRPNLTYLTVYADDQARQAAWKAFLAHPDWQTLKTVPKYANTVSKIHKQVLEAKPYSQL
ncbi:NIPSNAP family protein [Roseimaritima sediminicola]|uniref:NIPSNAP family protein n=1 Tax=Roseimaritima sediminicola TaxID=2662066 RepID=UPI0012983AE3|nr:NIPSNAP family protein [Roseimaritima sediminicola]